MPEQRVHIWREPYVWIGAALSALALVVGIAVGGLGGLFITAGLVALGAVVYAMAVHRPSWLALSSRKAALLVGGAASLSLLLGIGVYAGTNLPTTTALHTTTSRATASAKPSPKPRATTRPGTETIPSATTSPPATPRATVDKTALAVLATLPVKGWAPKTGYDRVVDFGSAWEDVDHNGCDTRDDILARDLSHITKSGSCEVLTGTLKDPYTGKVIAFRRGVRTSAEVQIDHVVALSDAWQTGAQQLSEAQRVALANDPMNLLAVDGPTNESKGDDDAATWLPPVAAFRCPYVARQISVKAAYRLWVTPAEHDAMVRVLSACPAQNADVSTTPIAPVPAPATRSSPTQAPEPAPAPSAPNDTRIVHPGAFCSPEGATGTTTKGTPMICTSKPGDRARWRAD